MSALWAGLLAFMIAKDVGVPVWGPVGDASDIGVVTACLWWAVHRRIAKDQPHGR